MKMNPFLISPPFGSYLGFNHATRVLGSYTLNRRPGRFGKTVEFFWQNLIDPVPGGWVNRIGLRNPGISAVEFNTRHLYSLVGLEDSDWEWMFDHIHHRADSHTRFELNLGCPNVHEYGIPRIALTVYCRTYWCGVKLPADLNAAMKIAAMAVGSGARYLHAGNTLPSPRGGLSGYPLKPTNLAIVEALAREFPSINIVGGGGNYTFDDLVDYRNAGATVLSFGTACFRPWRVKRLINQYVSKYGDPHSQRIVMNPL
jgi:dihydroorotate dehydrogenase